MKKLNKKLLAFSLSALMIAPLSYMGKTSFADETSSDTSVSATGSELNENETSLVEQSGETTESLEVASSENTSTELANSETSATSESTASLPHSNKSYHELDSEYYDKYEDLDAERITAIQNFLKGLETKSFKSKVDLDLEAENAEEKIDIKIEGHQTIADSKNQVANLTFEANLPLNNKVKGSFDIYSKNDLIYVDLKTDKNVSGAVKIPTDDFNINSNLSSQIDIYSNAKYKVKEHNSDGYDEIYVLINKDQFKKLIDTSFDEIAKENATQNNLALQQLSTVKDEFSKNLDEIENFSNVKELVLAVELKVSNNDNSVKELKFDFKEITQLIVDYSQAKSRQNNQAVKEVKIDDFKLSCGDIEILTEVPQISVPETVVNNAQDLNQLIAGLFATDNSTVPSNGLETTVTQENSSESSSN